VKWNTIRLALTLFVYTDTVLTPIENRYSLNSVQPGIYQLLLNKSYSQFHFNTERVRLYEHYQRISDLKHDNSYWPMQLLAKDLVMSVARPRSPILTDPVVPVMKMLSHLRSRWMTRGVRLWRNARPWMIWRHQFLRTLSLTVLKRLMYLNTWTRWWYTTGLIIIIISSQVYLLFIIYLFIYFSQASKQKEIKH